MVEFIQEATDSSKIMDYKVFNDKVYFDALLQVFDIKNKNGRSYPATLMNRAVQEQIQPKLSARSFVGELDHPIDSDINRKVTIEFKSVSHVFTDVWVENNKLYGHGETLMTEKGKDMSALIRDRIPIGFSLRAWGEVKQIAGTTIVQDPINIICYDCVQNPSYEMARITNITQESFNQMFDTMENENCMALVENNVIDNVNYNRKLFDKNIIMENKQLNKMYRQYLYNKVNKYIDEFQL